MIPAVFACAVVVLAAIPALLFLQNLTLYRKLPQPSDAQSEISILIPARDEAHNIAGAIQSALRTNCNEVVVLDDHSSDQTAAIVRQIAAKDSRVRLLVGRPLPRGWQGKTFACQQLATHARSSTLLFMDADVRITRADTLSRLTTFMRQSDAVLLSGVPHEITASWMERLMVPLIHFVLLGFLPIARMRLTSHSGYAAATGQVLAVRRRDYMRLGGHASIADRAHDGLALCRRFRAAGLRTDLFDATDTFACRMYQNANQVWRGFGKTAHEGLGSDALIVPGTLILLGGQVLPFVLLPFLRGTIALLLLIGIFASLLPRLIAAFRFRQSFVGALLHPVGVLLLMANQWWAWVRRHIGLEISWKGRVTYFPTESTSNLST
jgi:glycosyltransferase involved in cell wall biosynthesis